MNFRFKNTFSPPLRNSHKIGTQNLKNRFRITDRLYSFKLSGKLLIHDVKSGSHPKLEGSI